MDNGNVEHGAAFKRRDILTGRHTDGPGDMALSETIHTQRLCGKVSEPRAPAQEVFLPWCLRHPGDRLAGTVWADTCVCVHPARQHAEVCGTGFAFTVTTVSYKLPSGACQDVNDRVHPSPWLNKASWERRVLVPHATCRLWHCP